MAHPLPVIANEYLVTQFIVPTSGRHNFANVFCIHDTTGAATVAAIAAKVAASYASAIMPLISPTLHMGQTAVIPLDGVSATQTFTTLSSGTAGGHVGSTDLPNALSFVCKWQTGFRGRSHRGRSFIPGVSLDQVASAESNPLTNAATVALSSAGTNFLSALTGGAAPSLTLHVLSRKLGTSLAAASASGDAVAHIQRRRYESVARH